MRGFSRKLALAGIVCLLLNNAAQSLPVTDVDTLVDNLPRDDLALVSRAVAAAGGGGHGGSGGGGGGGHGGEGGSGGGGSINGAHDSGAGAGGGSGSGGSSGGTSSGGQTGGLTQGQHNEQEGGLTSTTQKDGQQGGLQNDDKNNGNQQPCKRGVDPACPGPDPGDGASSEGSPKPEPVSIADQMYDKSLADSRAIIEVQDTAVAEKKIDAPTKNWKDKYTPLKDETIELQDVYPSDSYYDYLKFKATAHYHRVQLLSKKPPANPDPDSTKLVVHEGLYGRDDKAIIARTSYRNRDGTPDAERIKWYEFAFKNWLDNAGTAQEAKELRWVVRDNIQNYETMKIIDQALRRGAAKVDAKGHGVFGPDDPNFKALAGTDNGRGVFYLTGRYHQQLGDLKVIKIHAWVDDGKYLMALELGH